jgi:NAD(P)-dependent dehydrogenase (short-subunit alcohol dehydrogenase family)
MAERFRGRVVVVTGASAGVGRAVARSFGAAGARVALLARGRDALEAAAAEVRAAGGDARAIPLDVADARAVDTAAADVSTAWGGLDVWVNDAMVSVLAPVAEIRPEEYRRVMEVNYLGAVHGTIAALRHMRLRGAGTIVQIGSALAYRSIPLQAAYCASKAALRGFTDSLRSELHHERSRIRVTMVHLPAVNTPQFEVIRNRLPRHARPVAPVFQPEVAARAVLYAVAHAPRELWVGWPTITAILGQTLVPGLLDRWLARKAWDGQMTDLAPKPRTDAVDAPLPGDRGAHGIFDAEARRRSAALFLRTHRGAVAAAALVAVGAAAAARGR